MDIFNNSDNPNPDIVPIRRRTPRERRAYSQGFLYALAMLAEDPGKLEVMKTVGDNMLHHAECDVEKDKQGKMRVKVIFEQCEFYVVSEETGKRIENLHVTNIEHSKLGPTTVQAIISEPALEVIP